jgi:hypothetical protein
MPSSNHMGSNTSNVRPRSIALKRGCKHYRAASGRLPLGIAKRTPPRLPMPMNLPSNILSREKSSGPNTHATGGASRRVAAIWTFDVPVAQPVMTCPEMIDGLLRASNARRPETFRQFHPRNHDSSRYLVEAMELITKVQVVSRGCFERLRRVFKRWRRPMNQICSFHKPNILLLGMRKMCLST